ncbi:hypothetical protein D9758_013599 [Tetrapyrgos nigripes]|uniref:Uncharacterized protein n=1 Tax=Tetrapyrgos nigripes TaxID=182062 RepID=A0A8H5FI73_9AGAR|nr:hypothetical protein D9758_013599 [Tetrapyrgos nigripes]
MMSGKLEELIRMMQILLDEVRIRSTHINPQKAHKPTNTLALHAACTNFKSPRTHSFPISILPQAKSQIFEDTHRVSYGYSGYPQRSLYSGGSGCCEGFKGIGGRVLDGNEETLKRFLREAHKWEEDNSPIADFGLSKVLEDVTETPFTQSTPAANLRRWFAPQVF